MPLRKLPSAAETRDFLDHHISHLHDFPGKVMSNGSAVYFPGVVILLYHPQGFSESLVIGPTLTVRQRELTRVWRTH